MTLRPLDVVVLTHDTPAHVLPRRDRAAAGSRTDMPTASALSSR
jgi:hypothetical protein